MSSIKPTHIAISTPKKEYADKFAGSMGEHVRLPVLIKLNEWFVNPVSQPYFYVSIEGGRYQELFDIGQTVPLSGLSEDDFEKLMEFHHLITTKLKKLESETEDSFSNKHLIEALNHARDEKSFLDSMINKHNSESANND